MLKLSVAVIQCIRSSGWTENMLIKVRLDLPKDGFVKIPRDDKSSIRMFVDVAAEHIVELRQSQASVSFWWDVNSSNNDL